jgi:signal transduction histidine kinase/ligand-binding sensor domain-containing protein
MSSIPSSIRIRAVRNHTFCFAGGPAITAILKYVYMTSCIGLLAASCSLGASAEAGLSSRPVLLPVVDGNDIRFTRLHSEQSQLQDEVNHIVQDDQGFIWLGTSDGLRRYDGYGFREYRHDPGNPNSISGATIYSLFKDRSGRLWVGSDGCLDMFDPATDKFTHFSGPGTAGIDGLVLDIRQDRKGMLWVASYQGLYRLDPATGQTVHYRNDPNDPSSLSSNLLKSTLEENDGTFWVATEKGLDIFDRGTGRVTRHIALMTGVEPLRMSLFQDHAGVLWAIFSSKNGLARVDRAANRVTQYSFNDGSGQNTGVDSIYEDVNGTLWLGTGSSGLLKLDRDRKEFVRYRNNPRDPESFGAGIVLALSEDPEGNIWAGTRGGATRFNRRPSPFQTYEPQIGSSVSQDVELSPSVFEDSRGVLWIGSQAVRKRIEGKAERLSYYGDAGNYGSLFKSAVRSIAEDHSGSLWFGTYGGLNRVNPRTRKLKTYRHNPADPQGLSDDNVPSLFVDHKGVLWVGTMDGLDAFDPGTDRFRAYRASGDGLNQYQVIAEDSQGHIWLGTQFSGLQRLDPSTGEFTIYRNNPGTGGSLSNDNVTAICIDASGTIWIGTQDGLNRFDPVAQTFTAYYERDGLPNTRVTGIQEDERGNLWLSTRNGLSRFDPRTRTFANYFASDGIVRGNIYGPHAGWKGSSGEMFFASTAGVIAFFPEKVVDNSYVAPVVLTDFQLFGKSAAVGGGSPLNQSITFTNSLTLSARQTVFSLEFSALSYVDPDLNRYRYRLEGLETEWNETSSAHRLVTYTTLPASDYVFHVQGANNRGLWNDRGASVRIRILPPWWSTSLFRATVVASLLLLFWCVYYLRVRGVEQRQAEVRALNEQLIKAQEAERMRIAGELHDGVLQQITSLTLKLGKVRRQVPSDSEAKTTVNVLQQELIQIGTDIRHISHELHPALLQESGLPAALSSYCEEFSKVRGLTVTCETDASVEELSPGAALCLYRIAQEALGNAAKYSEAKKVEVRLARAEGLVRLSVSDDGVGCTPDHIAKSGGLGVINMRERVLQLRGTFEFKSQPGQGTAVKAEVPFRPAS